MKNQKPFAPGTDKAAPPPKELLNKTQVDDTTDYVEVIIKSRDKYTWSMKGDAGMVVGINKGHAEVDLIGSENNISYLLATALIKTHKMLGQKVVDLAIARYMERAEKGQL